MKKLSLIPLVLVVFKKLLSVTIILLASCSAFGQRKPNIAFRTEPFEKNYIIMHPDSSIEIGGDTALVLRRLVSQLFKPNMGDKMPLPSHVGLNDYNIRYIVYDPAPRKTDTLKYQLSKHNQHKEGGFEYTSLFQEGDTVTTTRLKENFSYRVGIIHWRNKKVLFEYAGIRIDNGEPSGLHLEGDLKLK